MDTHFKVDLYDIEMEFDQTYFDELKAAGRMVICYISVGTVEEYRSDAY